MVKEKDSSIKNWSFNHPFIIVFSAIIIAFAGYKFGNWIYQLLHQ